MTIENKDRTAIFLMLAATFAHVVKGPVDIDLISLTLSAIITSVWMIGALLWLPDLLVPRRGTAQLSEPSQRGTESDAPTDDLAILHASYRGRTEESRMDVTELLQAMVVNGSLNVCATNDVMRRDPAPGTVKILEITYLLDGDEHTEMVPESWVLRIGKQREVEDVDEAEEIDLIQAVLDSTDEFEEEWEYGREMVSTETKTSSGSIV